jgi:hypothetical protein
MLSFLIAVLLAYLRIAGHKSEAFQAVAHLFVGWLLSAWWLKRSDSWISDGRDSGRLELRLAAALSIVEIACFIWSHH